MNTSEVIHFNETASGIICPICCKGLKNILKHLNNSKSCAANIDMGHFRYSYEIVKKTERQIKLKQHKQNERQRKREIDEEAYKKSEAEIKQQQRMKEREKDEEAFKKAMAEEKMNQRNKSNEQVDELTRRKNFTRCTIFGPIFTCSCCHRTLFENGVTKITNDFKEKLAQRKVPYSKVIPQKQEIQVDIELDGNTSLSGIYICLTCKRTLLRGKMPAMAVQNGLHLPPLPDEYRLTELENNLIAQNINFQYIFHLPKSRWAATKKQMISVPVTEDTVSKTLRQLPRLPKDAGLVPVNLKRKLEYRNTHKKEYIDPEKVLKVTKFLKDSGHPYYQFCDDYNLETYAERCKEQDKMGYDLLFGEEDEEEILPNNETGGILIMETENDINEETEEIGAGDNMKEQFDLFFPEEVEKEIRGIPNTEPENDINEDTEEIHEEGNNKEKFYKAYQELFENFEVNWEEIDDDKILNVIHYLSHDPNFAFLKDFDLDIFKKIYRKVTAGESIDGDSSVEENEEGTSDDDIENWTDVDSDGESEDDSTGSYEDVTIKVLYMGDKKVINMYRENSDMYKATLSERGLECLQASGHDVDLDKVRKNTYMIINKMTSEGLEEIKKAKKPKKKATYIHMDSKKGVLTMLIHMKLL